MLNTEIIITVISEKEEESKIKLAIQVLGLSNICEAQIGIRKKGSRMNLRRNKAIGREEANDFWSMPGHRPSLIVLAGGSRATQTFLLQREYLLLLLLQTVAVPFPIQMQPLQKCLMKNRLLARGEDIFNLPA